MKSYVIIIAFFAIIMHHMTSLIKLTLNLMLAQTSLWEGTPHSMHLPCKCTRQGEGRKGSGSKACHSAESWNMKPMAPLKVFNL